MSELKFRILQTANFLVVAVAALAIQILYNKNILTLHQMTAPTFTLTLIMMVVIQSFNYLEKTQKGRYIAYIYFVLLCCMMYYSKNITDIVVFIFNIFVTFSVIVERYAYSNTNKDEIDY